MDDIKFEGAAPDDLNDEMLVQVIDATERYAAAARERMGLHSSKRIAVTVPVDQAKRPLFERAEALLWQRGIRLDWSAYQHWYVPHHLADGTEPNDLIIYTPAGWRVINDGPGMTAGAARAWAARLLAAADACDEHDRHMPAPPAEPLPGI